MNTIAQDLMEIVPQSSPMHQPEEGASIIQYNFLKELIQRIKDKRYDLALRKLNTNGYAIELVVRNTMRQHDVATIGHCQDSSIANKYVTILHGLIKEYAEFD